MGNAARSKHAMENFNWANWFFTGDDDAILPGIKHLMANRKGVSMVIGQALCVSKNGQKDLTHYHGRVISVGKVSGVCALLISEILKTASLIDSRIPVSDLC